MTRTEIKNYMENISDEELYEMELEIISWNETGYLKEDGKVRELYNTLFDQPNTPLFTIQSVIEHEIALRWVLNYKNEKEGI